MSTDPAGFQCRRCGKWHAELPLAYLWDHPELYTQMPPEEQARRWKLEEENAALDDEHFFLRACVELPILGSSEVFVWSVWVTQSRESMQRHVATWSSPDRTSLPPTFGWFATTIPCYPPTLSLKTMVHQREPGQRPWVELERTDHPLALEQRNGITWERVREIAEWAAHQPPGSKESASVCSVPRD